ncbi:ABC transporter permease [Paraburkholderia sp. A2WS-5]|uniref:ABC transporter permease n=1 Tax=Paraburkholderia sp. A2WS-5 TaxID=3028372 RepID=UPI003B78EEF3
MNTHLRQSLQIQSRVIGALLMREIITRYGRHNVGFLWLFLEPMLFTMGITALWNAIKEVHGTNLSVTAFAVTGYSTILLWRNCSNRMVKALEVNQTLLYHRNVRVIDVFAARLLLEIAGASASLIVLTCIFSTVGWMAFPSDLLVVVEGWLLLAWFSFSLGLVVGALSERSEVIERVWHIFTYLMFPLSGAAYLVDWLPPKLQSLALWVPMVSSTEMMRQGYFGAAIHTHTRPLYLLSVNLVLTLIGLAAVNDTSRRVEPE